MKGSVLRNEARRIALIVIASVIIAINIKTFVRTGDLVPGGFTGLTLLLQRVAQKYFDIALPFSVINILLNAVPAAVCFKVIGKKFTLYSCLCIVLTSTLTDLIPAHPLTYDTLLISIFGGIINGFAICLCLMGDASGGGTDFIAIFFSERHQKDVWNYILMGNVCILIISGLLFGWDKALYSIFFQFTTTQIIHMMYLRYKKHTLFIITDYPNEVFTVITETTHHGATIFQGKGCYEQETRSMVYSVVSSEEVKRVTMRVRETDPKAFINVIKTDQLAGRFYQRPTD